MHRVGWQTRPFLDPVSREVTGLAIGLWGEVATGDPDFRVVVNALVAARGGLLHLRSLFLGNIILGEAEISWVVQSDVSPPDRLSRS